MTELTVNMSVGMEYSVGFETEKWISSLALATDFQSLNPTINLGYKTDRGFGVGGHLGTTLTFSRSWKPAFWNWGPYFEYIVDVNDYVSLGPHYELSFEKRGLKTLAISQTALLQAEFAMTDHFTLALGLGMSMGLFSSSSFSPVVGLSIGYTMARS